MKLLLTLFFFLTVLIGHSQKETTKIKFRVENNKIKTDDPLTQLKLPIELIFTSDFNKSLVILDSIGTVTKQKFGDGLFNPMIDGSFSFVIDTTGGIAIASKNERKITGRTIKLKIEDFDTVKLTINKSSKKIEFYNYTAGFIYYDAIKIADENTPSGLKLDILEKIYGINSKNISQNEYLSTIYNGLKQKGITNGGGLDFLAPISSADVTNFAAGLARFLAERAKEELNDAFFRKMEEQLNAYPELTTAFPQTSGILKTIKDYSYSSVLQVLKEAFETDVQNLPENIYQIGYLTPTKCESVGSCECKGDDCKNNSKTHRKCQKCQCVDRLKKLNDFFQTVNGEWLKVGMYTVKEAIQSTNPADLLNDITNSSDLDSVKQKSKDSSNFASYNLVSAIELGNLISQSLLSKEEGQVWVNSTEFNALFKTKDAFQIYVGLLLAKQNLLKKENKEEILFYKSKAANDTISLRTVLVNAFKQQEKLKNLIKTTYTSFNSANSAVKKMIEASSKSIAAEPQALYDYYKAFTGSLKQIAANPFIEGITGKDVKAEFVKITQFLDPAVDMAYHVSTKKYSSAIYDAVVLLNNINIPKFDQQVVQPFIKYGTLISTVASAQSSDEVKKAIEASVLPAGSSAVKRKTRGSISINGYVGAFGGVAWTKTRTTELNTSTNTMDTVSRSVSYGTYGLYAPVGLSFNLGDLGSKKKNGLTLGVQIIDLGALVNLYATKGDKAALPTDFKVRLSDILSPGIQIGYNVPNSPLTLMTGIQYVPALNNISQITSSEPFSPVALRAQLGIVVDIPLYNLKVWDSKK